MMHLLSVGFYTIIQPSQKRVVVREEILDKNNQLYVNFLSEVPLKESAAGTEVGKP